MPSDDTSFHAGHRERLRQKFIDDKLMDYELFELLLSYAIPRRDVRPLARGLIKKYGGIYQILTAPLESLIEYPGIGRSAAIFLKLIQRTMLINYRSCLDKGPVFHNPQILTNYCRTLLAGRQTEEFHVLYLDCDMRLMVDDLHSRGTVDSSAVYAREIVRRALELNARAVVLLHNHPTSGMSFSDPDIKTTAEVKYLLDLFGVQLYDHYVVSGDIVYSARNLLLIK